MSQHRYWHAPFWEVLLVVLLSLAFLGCSLYVHGAVPTYQRHWLPSIQR